MKMNPIAGIIAGFSLVIFTGYSTTKTAQSAVIADANIYVNLSKKLIPSVVNISTVTTLKSNPARRGGPEDMFRFFEDMLRQHGNGRNYGLGENDEGGEGDEMGRPDSGGVPKGSQLPRAMSLGTGFIIDSSGLILTNNHVVAEADEIKIQFTEDVGEKPTDGEVVGRDPELDLALIKVKTDRKLTPVILGDSDALEVGEYVMAVGNPFGQGHSVTHGIISAKERKAPDLQLASYLQTDAPINPGNSGGPLVNLKGEVIGLNNAIDQRAQGIGFAIPISLVKQVLPQLKTKGTVSRGYIGVLVNALTPEIGSKMGISEKIQGPFVTHVYPDGPAAKAGLKPYDVILEFNGKKISTPEELVISVTTAQVDQAVSVKVQRGNETKNLTVKVAQRPGAQTAHDQKKEKKPKKSKKSPHLDVGMELEDMTPEIARELGMPEKTRGIVVSSVAYGSAADLAGILRGDVIIEVDKKSVKSVDEFFSIVNAKKTYLLRARRADPQGQEVFTVLILDLKAPLINKK